MGYRVSTQSKGELVDLLGIGFGPSNLALAIAVHEHNGSGEAPLRAAFHERQPRFGWHRDMLIDDSTMQISYLKDLVTLRNPTSSFSFVAYLHEKGRLIDFINHQVIYPSRVEFHDYLEWSAARFADQVEYGSEVTAIHPVLTDDRVTALDVHAVSEDGVTVRRARNVVLATGLSACLPDGVERGDRIWHSGELLGRVAGLGDARPKRLAVVGAGQSAAEVTEYLHRTFTDAEVYSVFSRYGYSAADDSPFANRIFDPAAVDEFFTSDTDVRQMLLDYHAGTNYAVVDRDLINELYRRSYHERVTGRRRLRFLNVSRPRRVTPTADGVRLDIEHLPTRTTTALDVDYVVFATGYRPSRPDRLLDALEPWLRRAEHDELVVGRDYRVLTDGRMSAGVYVQGATEHLHGISSSLLSTSCVRAGEIAESVVEAVRRTEPMATGSVPRGSGQPRQVLGS
ncbi:lysine N(6)-hydroxylase/L-ornithine N(5)-oxygenase family protein [Saccharothrix xinjiangensis]